MTKLFLDDVRNPPDATWVVVRSYSQFTAYIQEHGCPDIISFDHDLAFEHYPLSEQNLHPTSIPYDKYEEKTGLHCARWLIENGHKPQYWSVHSMNVVGAENIRLCMRDYHASGEIPAAWRQAP